MIVIGLLLLLAAATGIPKAIALTVTGDYEAGLGMLLLSVAETATGTACFQETFIHRIQAWLMSRGEAATTAASISELLGGQDIEKVQ